MELWEWDRQHCDLYTFSYNIIGNVIHADILKNAEGRSRGLGVVMFERPEDATRAIGWSCDSHMTAAVIM